MQATSWLDRLIRKSAWELEAARKTLFQFGQVAATALDKNPIQPWEEDFWARGLKTGLLKLEGYFFRAGSGKRAPLSFFVRNEQDLYVGLRRESITQAATYVMLVTEYGYPRHQTRFESHWMDVAVYDDLGNAWIYAENKATSKTLQALCTRLSSDFEHEIPAIDPEAKRIDDAVMKAHHIRREKPRYFWAVAPLSRYAFEVLYSRGGFRLSPLPDRLPDYAEPEPATA